MLEQFVEHAVRALVEKPAQVRVQVLEKHEESERPVVKIHVAASDVQRVIGREGHVVRAIRMAVQAMSGENSMDVQVESAE
jgi:predicted RNA-binding protein YlqC (UPF0109 family)